MLGFLNINKPAGMTAHDVVSRVRRILRVKQIGHGGTLDPMATGVLPLAVGKATRLLRYLDGRKVYLAEILLGRTTTTDDIEGETLSTSEQMPNPQEVRTALGAFQGELEQIPPAYSAVHHQGERLYKLARQGKLPDEIAARKVLVHAIEIIDVTLPVVRVRIDCAAGTYIRSIARDLGIALSCGGCLQSLVREKAGSFELSSAVSLPDLEQMQAAGQLEQAILPPAHVLTLPALPLGREEVRRLTMGQSLLLEDPNATSLQPEPALEEAAPAQSQQVIVTYEGELIAVCNKTAENKLSPVVVISDAD